MTAFHIRRFRFVWPALLAALLSGCGDGRPRRVPVAGQIRIDGEPLTKGFIRVVPERSRAATGAIDQDGRFRLTTFEPNDGCVTGTHRAEVVAYETVSLSAIRWLVPAKYQKADTSEIIVTIDGPTDELLIELTWAGGQPYIERLETAGDSDPNKLQ
jgi:hypothetical protein